MDRIKTILEEWDFEKRKKTNLDECICYQQDKKCHNLEKLNCYFCYCPYYGEKCAIDSPDVKYVTSMSGKKILDCSDCNFPHLEENIKKILGQ
jgi:Zn-finger protein